MKKYSLVFLQCVLVASVYAAETPYDVVNKWLKMIDPSVQEINRDSSQVEVNRACNRQRNHFITQLKKAKAGSPARAELLKQKNKMDGACSTLESVGARQALHDRWDAAERQKREQEEKAKRGEKQPEKKEGPPKESDSGFIGKLKSFLQGKFADQKKDADAKIINLIGTQVLSKINIPSAAFKLFNNDLAIRDMKFLPAPTGPSIRTGLGFTGTTQFNNFAVEVTVFVVQDNNKKIEYSIGIELPDTFKISSMFPNFTKVDDLPIPKGRFIASTFKYTSPKGYGIEKGFNFVADLSLEGPLRALGELRKQASKYDFIVVDMAAPIYLSGVIDSMTDVTFKSIVPMRLGIDFVKAKKIPKGFSDVFNKILTDDFLISVVIKPLEQRLSAQSGVRFVLGSQKDTPFRLQLLGGVDILSGKINIAGKMPDMLELKFISLGEVMTELYWDPAVESVLAIFGVPVSGIALGGRIDLGYPGEKRASLNAKGKLSLETKKAADFVMEVEGKNIQFAEILSLVTQMAEKAGIKGARVPADKFPVMTINRAYGKAAPWDTEIAGEKIPAGFQLALDTQLFDTKFKLDATIKHKELDFSGSASMSPVTIKVGGKTILTLSGGGTYGGPAVSVSFNAKKPLEGTFGLNSIIDIPFFALKNKADLLVSAGAFRADFETDFLGFTTIFGISLPAKPSEKQEKETFERGQQQAIKEAEASVAKLEAELASLRKDKQSLIDAAQAKLKEKEQVLAEVKAITLKGQEDAQQKAIAKAQADVDQARKDVQDIQQDPDPLRLKAALARIGFEMDKIAKTEMDLAKAKRAVHGAMTAYKPPTRLEQTYVRFGFKGDFQEFLSKQAVPALQALKREASSKLAQVDKKIGELSGELEKLKRQQTQAKTAGVSATQAEINKTRATIAKIKAKIKSLRRECDKAPLLEKTYICPKVGAQITTQGTALAAQETYLNTLLKPGKAVISGTMDALNKINEATQKASTAIAEAKVFQKSVEKSIGALTTAIDAVGKGASIFKVTEAIGEANGVEMSQAKLPKLKSFKAEVNIPGVPKVNVNLRDLQFDFKNPKGSALDIAKKLIGGVKIG